MELYIAKKNETLRDIAMRFSVTYEELAQFNKTYKNRLDLEDCPVLVPSKDKMDSPRSVFVPNDNKNDLTILDKLITEYNHLLKEMIMASFYISGYENIIKEKLLKIEDKIKRIISKNKTSDVLKISSTMGQKDIIPLIEDFIKAIKNHEIESLKEELRGFKTYPKKVSSLYSSNLQREDKLKNNLKDIVSCWRDYILNIAVLDFNLAEKNFDDIEAKCQNSLEELV